MTNEKEKQAEQPSTEAAQALLTKEDIGEFFTADITGDQDENGYKLKVKQRGVDSEEDQSTFEGFIKKTAVTADTPKKNICVKLIAIKEDKYEFALNDTVISYHTFMFPFLYEMNKKTTRSKFEACCHPGWFPDVWEPDQMNNQIWYNQYHYFNETAHNAIYMPKDFKDKPEAVVRNLRFDLLSLTEEAPKADPKREHERPKNKSNPIKYVICKGGNKYYLDVNAIRMKLYNTGVGILIFELENRSYPSEKEVTQINDFGRRIYAPYYSYTPRKFLKFHKCKPTLKLRDQEKKKNLKSRHYRVNRDSMFCGICAEELYFEIDGKGVEQEQSSLIPKALRTAADVTVLAEPIRRLLSNSECRVTTQEDCAKDEICIEPVIDDRMFVACYYKNGNFVDAMREWDGDHYRYLTHAKEMNPFDNENNKNAAHRLYTMMYVDGDGLCCHSRTMLQKLLSDEHIYTRWLECGWLEGDQKTFAGTITGFSEYTMISVAKKPMDHLIDAFLTQYVEMAALALAQRASLLSFEYMISECAHGRNYEAENIHKKYVLFQSQLLLKELTPQQQGLELYDMLEKNLMIEKEKEEIKEQIEGLFIQIDETHDKVENNLLNALGFLGMVEVADILIEHIFNKSCDNLLGIGAVVLFLVGSYKGILAFLLKRHKF